MAGVDAPSQYRLLWNISADVRAIAYSNPGSVGDEGSDKDGPRTGYTPRCSPIGDRHEYTVTVDALSAPLSELPTHDDIRVDWAMMAGAMVAEVIATSSLPVLN